MTPDIRIDSTEALANHVARLVSVAKDYLNEQSASRDRAQEYYQGTMKDLPAKAGRSSVVSYDVRATIKKIMPSVMRTIFGGGDVVKYMPVGPGDEDGAQQATDYVNNITIRESNVEAALHDAIHDAMLLKTGILKWCAYRQRKVTIQQYTDQPDQAVVGLFDDPEVEILEYSESEETDADVLALDPNARRHSFKLRRVEEKVSPKIEAVPRGMFLITPGADSIEDAELVGEIQIKTRSQLVSEGYDKDQVAKLALAAELDDEDEDERMGEDYTSLKAQTRTATQEVLVYEVYVRVDLDDDGVAEIWRLVYGEGKGQTGQQGSHIVLGMEAVDEAPYAAVVMERDPHQFEGHSAFEDVEPIQRVKTALLRGILDNIYAQNNLRPYVNPRHVENPESLYNGAFGQPVFLKDGAIAKDAVAWESVPFVASNAFEMLPYWDQQVKERTGITDASAGLDADNLHNTSATAANLLSESGIAQADAIVRSLANGGVRKAFRGLLRLIIAHADGPRTVQLKGKWVQYDPRVWNMDMDCSVNVGLGGGSKERDMATLQTIYAVQKELLLGMGVDNPFVSADNLYNTLAKITETAGFPSPEPYFTQPKPEEVKARLEAERNKPNPDVEKIQAQGQVQMQVKQMDVQASAQLEQQKLALQAEADKVKAAADRDKEMAQMQADLMTAKQQADLEAALERMRLEHTAALEAQKMAFEADQREKDRQLEMVKLQVQRETAQEAAKAKEQAQ